MKQTLEQAAEQEALKAYPIREEWIGNQYGELGDVNRYARTKFQEGFKSGARWMAEQGVSYTDKIYNWSDDDKLDGVDENKFTLDGFGEEEALSRGVKQGLFKVQDKVIVQIRKAE